MNTSDGRRLARFEGQRIAKTLALRKGVNLERVLADIEAAMQRFWARHDDEATYDIDVEIKDERAFVWGAPKRRKAKAAQQLKRLKESADAFVTAVDSLGDEATAHLGKKAKNLLDLKRRVESLRDVPPYQPKGAGRKDAVRQYVTELAIIYQKATEREITRRFDDYHGGEQPHPFMALCMKAVGESYSERIVREVKERMDTNARLASRRRTR